LIGATMCHRCLPDPDQFGLARTMGDSLKAMLPLSRLQEGSGESAQTWTALQDLGVFGVALSADQGGSGLGAIEEALIAIELGRRAVSPSVLATMGAPHLRSRSRATATASASRIVAAGYRRADRVVFIEEARAGELLVREDGGARVFARPESSRLIDAELWSTRLHEASGLGEALALAGPAEVLRLRLIDAAALAGLACAALDMAVDYACLRHQFGRPIGSFQAVKHHCANMALAARSAGDQVAFAAVAVDDGRDDAALQVESALFVAGSAALDNCGKNIQVHGGIGFSEEALPHRLLKRARVIVQLSGGLEAALSRIEGCSPAIRSPVADHATVARRG
jgi:alkylation response protein AidB-like acyl-CoA dehydrogenase